MSDHDETTSDARAPILAVDMDETIIMPDTEEIVPGAKEALLALRKLGWKIIIWTCRQKADKSVPPILSRYGIPYDAINENLPEADGDSRKIIFDAVVDNKNVDLTKGWQHVVKELQLRRKGWQKRGLTKATIYGLDTVTGESRVLSEYTLDSKGRAVLSKGIDLELDTEVSQDQGQEFLNSLAKTLNTSYTWTEVE